MLNVDKGTRYEDLDSRQGDRVVRIISDQPRWGRVRVQVEVASLNPKTVGRKRWLKISTLGRGYRQVSH